MALIDTDQLNALAEDIVPTAPDGASSEQTAARTASVANVRDMAEKLMQYIVDQIEIKGVETDLDAGPRTIETYAAGVGDNGGALASATGGPVSGHVDDAKDSTGTQTNDGKGLVE